MRMQALYAILRFAIWYEINNMDRIARTTNPEDDPGVDAHRTIIGLSLNVIVVIIYSTYVLGPRAI